MSHEIYSTKGFIVSSENKAEADKVFFIFTKDLGLVRATAQGVRKQESKLRYALQDFSFGEFSMVLGKYGWRITNALSLESASLVANNETKVKTLRLIKKLSGSDEPNEILFNEIVSAFNFIDNNKIKSTNDKSIEALLVLKVLSSLGYWGEEDTGDDFVTSPLSHDLVDKVNQKRKVIIHEINKSLRATQLL